MKRRKRRTTAKRIVRGTFEASPSARCPGKMSALRPYLQQPMEFTLAMASLQTKWVVEGTIVAVDAISVHLRPARQIAPTCGEVVASMSLPLRFLLRFSEVWEEDARPPKRGSPTETVNVVEWEPHPAETVIFPVGRNGQLALFTVPKQARSTLT